MVTCRQCGTEYLLYEFEIPKTQEKSDITFDSFDIFCPIICFTNQEEQEKGGEIILSKHPSDETNQKLKICHHCLRLYLDTVSECENCSKSDFLEVYFVENNKKSNKPLNQQSNNKYCSSCKFEETRQSLIVPISKISDENCSHIIFDELFMQLPENKRKLLVFTDNVQRTSKFAREIEETHLKNIARAELQKRIEKLTEPIYLSNLIFEIINCIKRKTTINEYLELSLKKELYEELMSNGKKVASLANRGIFKLQIAELSTVEGREKEIRSKFQVAKEGEQMVMIVDTKPDYSNSKPDKSFFDKLKSLFKF